MSVNIVANPSFKSGGKRLTGWKWLGDANSEWRRLEIDASSPEHRSTGHCSRTNGVEIHRRNDAGFVSWYQVLKCKPGEFYRVEADVRANLTTQSDSGGVFLSVQPMQAGFPVGERLSTPRIHRSMHPTTLRAYWQAPEGIRRVEVRVGVEGATGAAWIETVRCMHILEPDEVSHPLALPTPAWALQPSRTAQRVCVCTANLDRPIANLLRAALGERRVEVCAPNEFRGMQSNADAILFIEPDPPRSVKSLAALKRLAAGRLVMISPSAFSRLAGDDVGLRRIEQPDDPIHARILLSHYATAGFALWDVFPFAIRGEDGSTFRQHQFRKTKKLEAFCQAHGFVPFLASMCEYDATSEQPIALIRDRADGTLIVLDPTPVECQGSTSEEANLAMHLLLSILGHGASGIGQFSVPLRRGVRLREMIREMGNRYESIFVHDGDLPSDEVAEQIVTIGREDETFGLPLQPKPLILLRSGLVGGDVESFFAVLIWLKQLVRMPPFSCPYVNALASRFRIAWIPFVARWETRDGWKRSGSEPPHACTLELENASVEALIDVVSVPQERLRMVVPRTDGSYEHVHAWLPRVNAAFPGASHFARSVAEGESPADRDRCDWRRISYEVRVEKDACCFRESIHEDVASAGGALFRIEIPGDDAAYSANSIRLTDASATLLEQTIGMLYGMIAVNRRTTPAHFDGFPMVPPGEALIVERNSAALRAALTHAG